MNVEERLEEQETKVLLPFENWYDLLGFVPRSQLGNVVSEIGDYEFTRIIQSFLHGFGKIKLGKMSIIPPRPTVSTDQPLVHMPDWPMLRNIKEFFARIIQFFLHGFGKIKLGKMSIIPPRPDVSSDQPMVKVGRNAATNMPDWPMPRNIKNFKQIDLNYVDASVLHFLEKFQENSLLTNVNMYFYCIRILDAGNQPYVLTKIAPFITSIDSIDSLVYLYPLVCNNNTNHGNIIDNESQLLLKEMMVKTRILVTMCHRHDYGSEYSWEDQMDWFCSWLYTPRNDRKSRMLRLLEFSYASNGASFIERIKKDFEMANHAVSFIIHSRIDQNDNLKDISFDNDKTNEKLVIKKAKFYDGWELWISRYPLNAAKSWIEANEKEISEWDWDYMEKKRDRKLIWGEKLDQKLSWGML